MWPFFKGRSSLNLGFPTTASEAKRIVDNAVSNARQNKEYCLSTAELLTSIMSMRPNEALDLLDRLVFDAANALKAIAKFTFPGMNSDPNNIVLTPYTRQVFERALELATAKGRKQIESIDLLIALAETPGSVGVEILSDVQIALRRNEGQSTSIT